MAHTNLNTSKHKGGQRLTAAPPTFSIAENFVPVKSTEENDAICPTDLKSKAAAHGSRLRRREISLAHEPLYSYGFDVAAYEAWRHLTAVPNEVRDEWNEVTALALQDFENADGFELAVANGDDCYLAEVA